MILRHLERMTGLSRQQVTRLVRTFQETGTVTLGYQSPRRGFKRVFGPGNVALLSEMDERHGTLFLPATKKLIKRACEIYGEEKYAVLSRISVAHLYNKKMFGSRRAFGVHAYRTNPYVPSDK